MKITAEVLRHVAQLAAIEVPDDRIEHLAAELGHILDYIDQLVRFDEPAEPMNRWTMTPTPRPDEIEPWGGPPLVEAAADRRGDEVRVPTVVKK